MSNVPPNATVSRDRVHWGGRAGALAALLALCLDLLWRSTLSAAGVPSVPESVVAAIARLTPTSLFGYATETFGSMAQNTLWALVLVGTVALGYIAGEIAGRWLTAGRFGSGAGARVAAAAIMAVVLFLIIAAVVLPLAREGFFGATSTYQSALLLQAALFAIIWGVAWAAIVPSASRMSLPATDAAAVSRRSAVGTLAAAALTAGVAVLGWRLAKDPSRGDVAAQEKAAAEIAASARGASVASGGGSDVTSSDESGGKELAIAEPATSAASPAATQVGDVKALFAKLESEGKLTPLITSVADFYHVSKNISDPVVDGDGWALKVDGKVAKPLQLTYDDVLARSKTTNITTLSCISNELNGDLAGTAEWKGFPLQDLLKEAGVDPSTVDIVFHAADGYDDSIPLKVAMEPTTLVVTGINGEPLPPDHGYPARLIVPPIYGMKNVKWVQHIEAVVNDYVGYWQTRGWSDLAPYQIWGRIDTPAAGDEIPAGSAVAAGVAAAGDRGISRVEISLDEGKTWADATLEPSINPNFTWVRWLFPFQATGPSVTLLMRATDGEGTVAPNDYQAPLPNGATGWPQRTFRVA
jgi:DMSO/TMAO reductase YedYZ molybdopterin-dependent catalytic subunit